MTTIYTLSNGQDDSAIAAYDLGYYAALEDQSAVYGGAYRECFRDGVADGEADREAALA